MVLFVPVSLRKLSQLHQRPLRRTSPAAAGVKGWLLLFKETHPVLRKPLDVGETGVPVIRCAFPGEPHSDQQLVASPGCQMNRVIILCGRLACSSRHLRLLSSSHCGCSARACPNLHTVPSSKTESEGRLFELLAACAKRRDSPIRAPASTAPHDHGGSSC